MRSRDFQALIDALKSGTSELAEDEIDFYRAAWSRPGALHGMVNWYRALLRSSLDPASVGSIAAPGLVIWGDRDRYGVPELAERSAALCGHAEVIHLDATHWLHHELPGHVSSAVINFLRS